MPDKFSFARKHAKTLVVEPAGANGKRSAKTALSQADGGDDDEGESISSEDGPRDLEEEERSIAAAVLYAESA